MSTSPRLSDAELAEIQRRRSGIRASLAVEGMVFDAQDDALFAQMDAERLTEEDRIKRIIQAHHEEQRGRAIKAAG